jgi:hypothetical protein
VLQYLFLPSRSIWKIVSYPPWHLTYTLVATSADSVPSSYLVRITIAPIGTTFGNLLSYKMATIDEFVLKNIGLWWRYGISRHCDEWKYIIIRRIFECEIILIPPSLKISESSSNGSYRNTDEVWWRYGISRSCDECIRKVPWRIRKQCLIEVIRSSGVEMWRVDAYQIPYYSRGIEGEKRTHPRFADCLRILSWWAEPIHIWIWMPNMKNFTMNKYDVLLRLIQNKDISKTRQVHVKSLPQYLGCNTVFDMRLRVTFLRRKTVSLQSNIAHRE